MAGGMGILGGYGLRYRVTNTRLQDIEEFTHRLANQSLQMDADGNVDISGVLNIGTAGELRQGTGTLGVDFTGLRIWHDTSIGRIAGYNTNVLQWYGDTDGKFYAGAGNVSLDANGIQLVAGTGTANRVDWTSSGNIITYIRGNRTGGTPDGSVMTVSASNISDGEPAEIILQSLSNSVSAIITLHVDGGAAASSSYTFSLNGSTELSIAPDSTTVTGGLNVGTATAATTAGEIAYSDDLEPLRGGVSYTGYVFVPLVTPLTSASWDGDAYSTTASTLLDLSTVFGAPAGIKAVALMSVIRDSASSTSSIYFTAGANDGVTWEYEHYASGLPNDTFSGNSGVVPCDANGDIYYSISASGASTMDIWLRIVGYWI